jgi:PAS domain S-box-containing protein
MHRPQSHAETTPPVRLWLRTHGRQALVLAVLYFVFGHASFLVQVDDVLVTPVLFAPEGIALAMALRFGAAVWPGVFAGQLVLALSRGLAPWPAVSIAAVNSLEVVLAVFLFRAFKLDATLPRARDLTGLLLLVFFVLQPFSATFGNAALWAGGIIDRAALPTSWLNWWIGNSFGQMLVTPLLLALFAGGRTKRQTAGDFVVPLLVILPAFWAADYLLRWAGVSSLVVVFAPILVLLAIYRGLVAVCAGGFLIALGALYATSHAFGPFVSGGRADIPGLNLFIIGLALSGQFLAVFLRQLRAQQKLSDQLRDAREQWQRTAYELTENIPVGTYVLEFDADGKPHFTFLSERFLAMTGLKREELMANHALALQPMSSSGRSEIERLNREVFASKKTFFWEGEITVRGEKRHVTLESMPRSRSDGGTIWEGVMTDVTERRKSEQQLRLVLDNLPIAVAATTLTSPADLTFINKQFTRTFGYTLEDVPTVAAWAEKAYPDPDYRREVFRNWDQAVFRAIKTRGSVELMEFEVTCQDGTKRNVVFGAVVLDERLLVSMTDVTELKKAERQVRSLREEIERAAFEVTENIPVGTYTMAQPPGGGMASFSFMSTRFLELTGLERAAAEADPLTAFACVHPDDYDEWVRKNAYVFEHKLPFKEETRVVVDGQTRWITAESTPRDMPDGSVVWEGVLTDITERKQAEAALRQVTQRMQLAAAAAGIGFWSRDRESRIEEWDDQMFRIYGVSREDFDGRWEPLVHPDDLPVVERLTEEAFTGGHTGVYEYRIVRPDGTVRYIRGLSVRASGPQGESSREIGVNFDITEEKEAARREKEFDLRHRRELENKLKTSLTAAAVAHEINQPLSTILLTSKMALESGTGTRDILQSIAAEAQRVVVTIDKMKTLLRNVQTDHRQIDLAEVVQSTLLYNKGLLARHNIRVVRTGLKKSCRIMGDDVQLQLALTNLLRNAVEAIEESQPEKREIAVAIKAGPETVELIVGDSGPGWSGAPIVETPLHTTKKGGTGIGLYVVRTAMENHRGEITFGRSALGGAEVRLKFLRVEGVER